MIGLVSLDLKLLVADGELLTWMNQWSGVVVASGDLKGMLVEMCGEYCMLWTVFCTLSVQEF